MRYRKLPVVVDAVRWDGSNVTEIDSFTSGAAQLHPQTSGGFAVRISTLEGEMVAGVGDWIIRGVHGEYYPCKPDIFEKSYQEVSEDEI